MPLLGQLALWLALLLSVWGAVIGLAGGRHDRPDLQESARRATVAVAAALLVALWALVLAVLRRDFRVAYVAAHADRTLAARDTWGVLLDGIAGRLLVTAAAAAACIVLAHHTTGDRDRRALAHAVGLALGAVSLAVAVLLVAANPFALLSFTPIDGQGLSQRLGGSAAQLYLSFLYVGVAALVVAGAWKLAARRVAEDPFDWDRARRGWLVGAWLLLTVAAALGLWVDYDARGWGGAWFGAALQGVAVPVWGAVTLAVHAGARSPVRLGAHLAHAGGALVVLGLLGAAVRTTVDAQLRPGESAAVGRHTLTYVASSVYPASNQIVTTAVIEVRRAGRAIGRVVPRLRQQIDAFGSERFAPAPSAGIRRGLREDVHSLLLAAPTGGNGVASFRFAINPLARWIWVGTALMVAGGVLSWWPGPRRS